MTPTTPNRPTLFPALAALGLLAVASWGMDEGVGAEPHPVVLKGVVQARGSMGPFRYTVEGTGPLLPDSPGFKLSTSVPVTHLASAKPVVVLESPRGKITIKITQEISMKEKTVVPFIVIGGTDAYARASGAGRIKIELLERSGFSGTVKLTFLRPAPASAPDADEISG
ncbi:hypothetical protein TA3x_002061 [Tundrisphaera sp. TA3]|uniref:hypothetical protein n=1 Tax=Tundrisphaera sp. TA3 TaxID=3435775 RepID=UPI003EBC3EED